MLSEQFFNRAQLSKILGFKSVAMLQSLENKGFITPQIKPSKYSLNQALFMMICKELIDFTNFSWRHLNSNFSNEILSYNLLQNNLMIIINYFESDIILVNVRNDNDYIKKLEECLDFDILNKVSNIDGREHTTFDDIPSILITPDKDRQIMTISLNRIYRKLQYKCTELKINLEEKVPA
ncbi:MAG: hypothetical protein ACKPEN_08680 [Planktothrix sp.]|uniref:hypothetical protein n=1 Tax=Planktothrix sp. TaxID=3088171 RepID=UPI0038D46B0F